LFILDHNFRTRSASKSIKVSKDIDSSLVSNENFSTLLLPSVWAQVRYQQPKMAKNTYLTYDITKKTKPKMFFSLQTLRLSEAFEGLNSSRAQSAEELCIW